MDDLWNILDDASRESLKSIFDTMNFLTCQHLLYTKLIKESIQNETSDQIVCATR